MIIAVCLLSSLPALERRGAVGFVLAIDGEPGMVRLSRLEANRTAATRVWRRRVLPQGSLLLDASRVDRQGRIFLLIQRGSLTEALTIDASNGRWIGLPKAVAKGWSGIGLLGDRPFLLGHGEVVLLGSSRSKRSGDETDLVDSLVSSKDSHLAYYLDRTSEGGGASGCIGAFRLKEGRLMETYRRDVVPGPYAFAAKRNAIDRAPEWGTAYRIQRRQSEPSSVRGIVRTAERLDRALRWSTFREDLRPRSWWRPPGVSIRRSKGHGPFDSCRNGSYHLLAQALCPVELDPRLRRW